MTTLAAALGINDTVMAVSPALDVGNYLAPYTIDSEAILVTGGDNTASVSISRGQNGTARAAHALGATVTEGWGGGGSQTLAQTLALGNDANQLRITNAADGVDSSDAATVGQLGGAVLHGDGAPEPGGNQSYKISGSPTMGTFTLTFRGQTTAPIAFDATGDEIATALGLLSTVGPGNMRSYPGYGTATLNVDGSVYPNFINVLGSQAVEAFTVTDSTDGNLVITEDTAGFAPTPAEAVNGSGYVDDQTGFHYQYIGVCGTAFFSPVGWIRPGLVGQGAGSVGAGELTFFDIDGATRATMEWSPSGFILIHFYAADGTSAGQLSLLGTGLAAYVAPVDPVVSPADTAVNAVIASLIAAGLMAAS